MALAWPELADVAREASGLVGGSDGWAAAHIARELPSCACARPGGAGMGGAVFVMDGASLAIVGTNTIAASNVHGGSADPLGGGTNGQAFDAGMFLQGSGTLSFQPGAGETQTISDGIYDEKGVIAAGYAPPSGFVAGSWSLTVKGAGTLLLSGKNTYSGGATIEQGTLALAAVGGALHVK